MTSSLSFFSLSYIKQIDSMLPCFQISSFSTLNATISYGEFQIPVTIFLLETSLPWIRFADRKNWNFDQALTDLFTVLFILGMAGSRYKTNCDFGDGNTALYWRRWEKIYSRIGLRRFSTPPNTRLYFLPTSRQYNAVLPFQNRN